MDQTGKLLNEAFANTRLPTAIYNPQITLCLNPWFQAVTQQSQGSY